MILHTLNKHQDQALIQRCLKLAGPEDQLLLIEEAVYLVLQANEERLSTVMPVYALEEDVAARGLQDKLCPNVKLVDYNGFVTLAATADKIQAWF